VRGKLRVSGALRVLLLLLLVLVLLLSVHQRRLRPAHTRRREGVGLLRQRLLQGVRGRGKGRSGLCEGLTYTKGLLLPHTHTQSHSRARSVLIREAACGWPGKRGFTPACPPRPPRGLAVTGLTCGAKGFAPPPTCAKGELGWRCRGC
jgi:hypothetical protein